MELTGRRAAAGLQDARRRSLVLLLVAVAMLGMSARASAVGELAYDRCSSNTGSNGACIDLPGNPIGGDPRLAVNPNGKAVYVAAGIGVVSQYETGADGRPAYSGCFSDDGSNGACNDLPGSPLLVAYSVAVSPNGDAVYVVGSGGILHFDVDSDGLLSYEGCMSNDGSGGFCVNASGSPLTGLGGLAVSPNSASVYVGTVGGVTHLGADAQGRLTYLGCVTSDGSGGACADGAGSTLDRVNGIAVSPDGQSVYAVSETDNALTHFSAGTQGQLTDDACASDDGSGGTCADVPGTPLRAPESVAVSPNGISVYVGGYTYDTVTHFVTDFQGPIAYDGCASHTGSGNLCLPTPSVTYPESVAVSPDSESIYVAGYYGGSLTRFGIASREGQLAPGDCFSNGGSCVSVPGNPLRDGNSVAVSANGKSVYVSGDGGLSHFFREDAPPKATITDDPGSTVKTSSDHAKVRFAFKSNTRGARFKCKLDSKAFKSCESPKHYVVGIGKHTFKLKSTDAFGTKDKAKAKFKVVKR